MPIGTQTVIAEEVVRNGGQYILTLKQNQALLFEDAQLCFETEYLSLPATEFQKEGLYAVAYEKDHGRLEKRRMLGGVGKPVTAESAVCVALL